MRRPIPFLLAVAGSALALILPLVAAEASPRSSGATVISLPGRLPWRPLTTAGRLKQARGYLVRDEAAYVRAKAMADGRSEVRTRPATAATPLVPNSFRSWNGVRDKSVSPSDSTGAIGPTRYIELVNLKFGIYSRTANKALATGTLASLTGDNGGNLSDPQVIWDPDTSRFYYAVLDFSSNILLVGFSKTDTPGSGSDFCKYGVNYGYGTHLPDYPKLGDTKEFLLMGVNVFDSASPSAKYLGSDIDWITKPAAGSSCPPGSAFVAGRAANVLPSDFSTPVPANQTDGGSNGSIVAAQDPTVSGTGSAIDVLSVTNNGGVPSIQSAGTVSEPTYSVPPSAPQSGTSKKLDTLDGRLTQAVSAIDPLRGGGVAVWTQHTVAGGAGSEVRWYELDPAALSTPQSGTATSATLYTFNGAISPDRVVSGSTTAFGDSMVLGFDTSSASTLPGISMVSKVGAAAQSGFVTIKASSAPDSDFTCSPCRWGDYAGASPDPLASVSGAHGQVWLTSMWNGGTSLFFATWRTWNWAVAP